jgi:hypothetical protein
MIDCLQSFLEKHAEDFLFKSINLTVMEGSEKFIHGDQGIW